jgi:hypothetical protein
MVGRLELRDDFKEEAEWRREKAKQSPGEERYLAAAAIFDRLAATVDAIPQDVFITFSEHPEIADGLLDVERWTEMLRAVGFGSSPETAEEFVRSFIADRMARRG